MTCPEKDTFDILFDGKDPEKLPPLDRIFPSKSPLEIDVGCGKGRFLLAHAAANPAINMIGIEKKTIRIHKVERRIRRENLTNIRLIHGEAFAVIETMLPPLSVDVFYFFFQDPWPKRRHHRRRLFSTEFMDKMHSALKNGGLIHVATDHMDYFEAISKVIAADKRFEAIPAYIPPEEERTDFEIIFLGQNKPIGRCSMKKK